MMLFLMIYLSISIFAAVAFILFSTFVEKGLESEIPEVCNYVIL